jgi:hypothetical protein
MRNSIAAQSAGSETCGRNREYKRQRKGKRPFAREKGNSREKEARAPSSDKRRIMRGREVKKNADSKYDREPRREPRGIGFRTQCFLDPIP